jgi:hypothetical protein
MKSLKEILASCTEMEPEEIQAEIDAYFARMRVEIQKVKEETDDASR